MTRVQTAGRPLSGLSEEERKSNPAYAEKLTPLLAELVKANAEAVETVLSSKPLGSV